MHVDSGPVRWYARHDGPGRGRPIVFFHGFAGTGADWDGIRQQLPPGWRSIAPDLPGHGESALPPGITFDKFPSMVDEFLRSLEIEQAVFVGYSFGARLALSVATQMPQRVEALVLESVHPGLTHPEQRGARRAQDEEDARTLDVDGLRAFLDQWHERPVFSTRRGTAGWTEEVARKQATNNPRRLAVVLRGLGLAAQPDFAVQLRNHPAPMLLIAGERDPSYVEHAKRIAMQRPERRRLAIAPCGHNVHTEEPLVFRDALHAFLQAFPSNGAEPDGV